GSSRIAPGDGTKQPGEKLLTLGIDRVEHRVFDGKIGIDVGIGIVPACSKTALQPDAGDAWIGGCDFDEPRQHGVAALDHLKCVAFHTGERSEFSFARAFFHAARSASTASLSFSLLDWTPICALLPGSA